MPADTPRPNRAARRSGSTERRSPFPVKAHKAAPPREWAMRRR